MFSSFSRFAVRSAIVACAVAVAGGASVYAMRVSPMIVEMSTVGADSVARIEVQNLNAAKLPFETRITELHFDENGVPSETPADGDFLIFPPQGLLPQGARQVIRVQWVGAPDIPTSRAYYLSVNQLPVPTDRSEGAPAAQVQVVYHMRALVVVAPPGAEASASAVSVKSQAFQPPADAAGAQPAKTPGIEIVIKNTGRRHAMMSALRWIFDGKDQAGKPLRIIKTQEDLTREIGSGYVPGNGTRVFRLPVAKEFGPGTISAKFAR